MGRTSCDSVSRSTAWWRGSDADFLRLTCRVQVEWVLYAERDSLHVVWHKRRISPMSSIHVDAHLKLMSVSSILLPAGIGVSEWNDRRRSTRRIPE